MKPCGGRPENLKNGPGLNAKLNILPDRLDLDAKRSTTLFRIYQEALTNVARHAEASRVDVRCEQFSDRVELEVKDNGRGIDQEKISNSHSLGLAGIRERVLLWKGEVHITGKPGQGTRLFVRIPTPIDMKRQPSHKTKIVIADDHAVVRMGLVQIISETSDLEVIAEAENGNMLLDKIRTLAAGRGFDGYQHAGEERMGCHATT